MSRRTHLHTTDPREAQWSASLDRCRRELAGLLSSPPSIELTSSCTVALEAAAAALDIRQGDEVVVPAYSFPSSAGPFVLRGANLRFADADDRSCNVDPAEIERCLTPRTKAVVVMHYGGNACDLAEIQALIGDREIALIEDAAHSLFASYRGRPLGRFGAMGAFSFHRTKNVSSFEGGALVVNDPERVDAARVALDKGTDRAAFDEGLVSSYQWAGVGTAGRLAAPLAPMLEHGLMAAPSRQGRRHRIWDAYRSRLEEWADHVGARLPPVPGDRQHSAHLFWVRLPASASRSEVVAACDSAGVEIARHFGSLPGTTFGRSVADPRDRCPRALEISRDLVRLPLHAGLTDSDVDHVVDTFKDAVGHCASSK